jgi:hypothetical protein
VLGGVPLFPKAGREEAVLSLCPEDLDGAGVLFVLAGVDEEPATSRPPLDTRRGMGAWYQVWFCGIADAAEPAGEILVAGEVAETTWLGDFVSNPGDDLCGADSSRSVAREGLRYSEFGSLDGTPSIRTSGPGESGIR